MEKVANRTGLRHSVFGMFGVRQAVKQRKAHPATKPDRHENRAELFSTVSCLHLASIPANDDYRLPCC